MNAPDGEFNVPPFDRCAKDVVEIADAVYQISEFKLVNYYLVIGSKRAMLIDTGCGLGNVSSEIRELTTLPISVVLTHGHMDHSGSAHQFDDVWMHPGDLNIATEELGDRERIAWYVRTRSAIRNPGMETCIESHIPSSIPASFNFSNLSDLQTFDLGDRRGTVIFTPGHTEGSVCYLDDKSRILFGGDTLNNSSIIPTKPRGTDADIIRFRLSLHKLNDLRSTFDSIAVGHDGQLVNATLTDDYLWICDEVLKYPRVGKFEESGIRKGWVMRHGEAELWYDAHS